MGLKEICNKYPTDKGQMGYVPIYENLFNDLKDKPIKILEIGIKEGGSIKMWSDYFEHGEIYGFDLGWPRVGSNDYFKKIENDFPRVKTFIGDQRKRDSLLAFIKEYGGEFDIIIDDGGHSMPQQQISFGYLFPYVKTGGIYVIEDLVTSDSKKPNHGVLPDKSNTTMKMLNDYMVTKKFNSIYIYEEEKEYVNEHVLSIEVVKSTGSKLCAIKKK